MNDKLDFLSRTYELARMKRLCKNQKEFADLIGISRTSLSLALNGAEAYLTDNLMVKLRLFANENGLEEEPQQPKAQEDNRPDIVIPAATMELYTSMAKSIDRLTALVERMQPGASAFTAGYSTAPKNYRTDGK